MLCMTIHSGERAMWAAVLIQALRDIAGTSGDSEYHKSPALHRDRALLWRIYAPYPRKIPCETARAGLSEEPRMGYVYSVHQA